MHVAGTASGAYWAYEQIRELRARGHDATAVIADGPGTLGPLLAADGIPYETADFDIFARNPLRAATRVLAFARLLRRLRPDVVHYHLFGSIILGRIAAWLADVPVRVSMIPGPYYLEAPGLQDLDARTARLDTKVVASCERTRDLYEAHGVPRAHVDLIYYGQDVRRLDPDRADGARVRRELGIDPDRPVVGDVAYFYPPQDDGPFTPPFLVGRAVKGHEVLLRAVPLVLADVPDALFLLVGEGWGPGGPEYRQELEALARSLGVAHAVRFTGVRSDIPDTLAAFDVSVQCSLNENLGGSIESLMMARPFIASAVGGLVDAVVHERTGLLVSPDDAPALARAIVRLLRDRPLARRLATEGRARALALFTLERAVDDLEALYTREVGRRRAHGYMPWRSAWRAIGLPFLGWQVMKPMRQAMAAHRRRAGLLATAGRTPRFPRLAHLWRVVRGRDLRIWGPRTTTDVWQSPHAAIGRPSRIVQMAGIVDNGDWLVAICRNLRAGGADVAAIIGAPEGAVAAGLRDAGVPYQSLSLSFSPGLGRISRLAVYAVRTPWAVFRLARLFRRERVDVVHTHVFNTILIGRLAAWIARVPCRVSMVPGPLHLEAPLTAWADRMTWWMDHHVIAGCQWTEDRYRALGMTAPRLARVPYGADGARFDPSRADGQRVRRALDIDAGTPLVGLVAYFYPPRHDWQAPPAIRGRGVKGHEDFITAARLVLDRYPDARFVVAGGGWGQAGERYRDALMARCREDGLGDAILFIGRRDDVPDVLTALDVAVQCSLTENYGGTIEALLMERPTVATRVGGMPETVRHGETGLLVPPRDPEALAAAIVALLDDPARARAMAIAGRDLMRQRFLLSGTADGIAEIYARHFAAAPPAAGTPDDGRVPAVHPGTES